MTSAKSDILFASTTDDAVRVNPVQPSTADSLVFNVLSVNHCCCTEYFNKKVSVSDSTITLFASYNDRNCQHCECLLDGSNNVFSCGPLKEGKYRILGSEDMYCPPGQICPAIDLPVRLLKLGEIKIKAAHSTDVFDAKNSKSKSSHSMLWYSSTDKKITFKLSKAQYVLVTAYIVNGEKSTELSSKKFLPAGVHSFRMDQQRFKSGVMVIHVKGDDFSEVRMINLTK